MNGQGVLFPTDGSDDQNFEHRREVRYQRRKAREGDIDFIAYIPCRWVKADNLVTKYSSGKIVCSCGCTMPCRHVKGIRFLLRLRQEAGYTGQTEKQFLKSIGLFDIK